MWTSSSIGEIRRERKRHFTNVINMEIIHGYNRSYSLQVTTLSIWNFKFIVRIVSFYNKKRLLKTNDRSFFSELKRQGVKETISLLLTDKNPQETGTVKSYRTRGRWNNGDGSCVIEFQMTSFSSLLYPYLTVSEFKELGLHCVGKTSTKQLVLVSATGGSTFTPDLFQGPFLRRMVVVER